MSTAAKKAAPDWERIEQDYRAGLLSIREIAISQGITHGAINKRAKRDKWERDLTAKIKAKADALVSKREVSTQVSTEQVATDRAIIEANAEVIANIRLGHRKDIGRARKLVMGLLDELEVQTDNRAALVALSEALGKDGATVSDKALAAFNAISSLPGRTKTMKDLGDTLHKLIGLEREAYNVGHQASDVPPPPPAPGPGVIVIPADLAEAQRVYQRLMSGADA